MRIICTLDAHQKVAPMRIKTGGDAHPNGRRCVFERAEMRIGTGNHRAGFQKASCWFCKTIVMVFTNHRVGFPSRCRSKPVPFRIITRSPSHNRPFCSYWQCFLLIIFHTPVQVVLPEWTGLTGSLVGRVFAPEKQGQPTTSSSLG